MYLNTYWKIYSKIIFNYTIFMYFALYIPKVILTNMVVSATSLGFPDKDTL